MNVVFIHCHFERGGVTQVVENQIASINKRIDGRVCLASGGRNGGLSAATLDVAEPIVVEALDYDAVRAPDSTIESYQSTATKIAAELSTALVDRGLESSETILHWHNHSLAKNVALPEVIDPLLDHLGYRQLLQIHDFAEDYRPENFNRFLTALATSSVADVTNYCNPMTPAIHYATLTRADASVLQRIGIAKPRIHLLPNSVTLGDEELPDRDEALARVRAGAGLPKDARWCVYPVRGIRRKNVGEFLLLSRLIPENTFAGITLPPKTDIERRSYERWRGLALEVAPRAVFDAGTFPAVSFLDNIAASDFVLSTSVAEGFGMAFLEPWLASRGVIARQLPSVVDDFVANGVCLDRFYHSINIPGSEDWVSDCRKESDAAFAKVWEALPEEARPRPKPPSSFDMGTSVDFAQLTTHRQIEVLRRSAKDSGFEQAIRQQNPVVLRWFEEPFDDSVLLENRSRIRERFSLEIGGDRLLDVYQKMLAQSEDVASHIGQRESHSIVDIICSERAYFPCRTESEIAE